MTALYQTVGSRFRGPRFEFETLLSVWRAMVKGRTPRLSCRKREQRESAFVLEALSGSQVMGGTAEESRSGGNGRGRGGEKGIEGPDRLDAFFKTLLPLSLPSELLVRPRRLVTTL